MKRKQFKRQSDLTKYAIRRVIDRQFAELRKAKVQVAKAGDFLQQCAAKLRLPR